MGKPRGKDSWESLVGKPRGKATDTLIHATGASHCCYSSGGKRTCMPPLETRTDSPRETPEVPQGPCKHWRGFLRFRHRLHTRYKAALAHIRRFPEPGRSVRVLSWVRLFVTPWTGVHQVPGSMGSSWQEYWSGLPFPPPGDLPDPGIEPASLESPALAGGFFTMSHLGSQGSLLPPN